jgi:hypothetical protein
MKKTTKLPALHLIAGTDPLRPMFESVHFHNKKVYVTDTHKLVIWNPIGLFSDEELSFFEGKSIAAKSWKDMCESDYYSFNGPVATCTNFKKKETKVIQFGEPIPNNYFKQMDSFFEEFSPAAEPIPFGLNPSFLLEISKVINWREGTTSVKITPSKQGQPMMVQSSDSEFKAILMPCMINF